MRTPLARPLLAAALLSASVDTSTSTIRNSPKSLTSSTTTSTTSTTTSCDSDDWTRAAEQPWRFSHGHVALVQQCADELLAGHWVHTPAVNSGLDSTDLGHPGRYDDGCMSYAGQEGGASCDVHRWRTDATERSSQVRASQARALPASCALLDAIDAESGKRLLKGRHLMLVGDSTTRILYSNLAHLVAADAKAKDLCDVNRARARARGRARGRGRGMERAAKGGAKGGANGGAERGRGGEQRSDEGRRVKFKGTPGFGHDYRAGGCSEPQSVLNRSNESLVSMHVCHRSLVVEYPCWGGLLPLQEELLCPKLSRVHLPSVLPASP